jgi:hypothetical protein
MKAETIARFWAKVKRTQGCWLWSASKRSKGYGAFVWADGSGHVVQGRAHRFAWELANGPIPVGACVLHRCDTPACVRVEHLFLGTRAENNADMRRKGRAVAGGTYSRTGYARGEKHHNARLTKSCVDGIRASRRAGMSYGSIAKKYEISLSHAWRIANDRAWSPNLAGKAGHKTMVKA